MKLQDAIYELLGVPPEQQPADYYRLLGLARFETNREVIANAASRQMLFVRQLAAGPYSTVSQDLLDLLSEAKVCLLNSERRRAYDVELRQRMICDSVGPGAASSIALSSAVSGFPEQGADPPPVEPRQPQANEPLKGADKDQADDDQPDDRSDNGDETNISGPPNAGGDGQLESIGSYHGHEPVESIGSASFSVTSAFGPNPSRRVMAPFGKPLDPARVTPGTIYPADYESDTGSSGSQDSDGGDVSVHAFPGSSSIGAPGAMAAKITRQWTIGADEHCDIVVRCPYVSRRHCRVTESESRYWIEDLGSRNGTHVNSRVVNGRVLVTADDMITLGTLARMPWPPSTAPVCRASGSNEVRIVRIGRSPSSDIRLNHSSVSRRHAQLSIFGDHMVLEDLGSTNGTFVGDSSLRINRQRVALSDTVRIGKFSFPVSHLLRSESVA